MSGTTYTFQGDGAVQYDGSQTLTDVQKATALGNIGATSTTDVFGKSATATGGLLVQGFYARSTGAITSSSNFNCYKFDISGADFVKVSIHGYDSTIAVASNSDYDSTSIIGKTFSKTADKFIGPSTTMSSLTDWTECATVKGYSYLYVSSYKTQASTVEAYTGNAAYPIALDASERIISTYGSGAQTVVAQPNTRYVFGQVSTLTLTPCYPGSFEVMFTSGSSPTVLAVSGYTVHWPDWFDPTALEANRIYDMIITDGEFGVVTSWAI